MSDQRYLVTARKYRPTRFGDLVGQEHVSDTLKNAIRMDRLAHAYLFSGPRGVGKTTAARILAKSINCQTPHEARADGAEPCGTCDSCRSFAEGRSLNIIEIDAASNNKVDDIRELRDTVRVPPQGARKKVYIVDEVHMLSTSAFNALLKTLEEPPPYVLFIFATTEPHKVLPTILSRCQRFDFRRIAVADAVARLREICQAENIEADEDALLLIARKGDGALRDTLSVFDQSVALVGTQLDYPTLAQALGVVEVDLYFAVTDAVAARDTAALLTIVDRVVRRGYDLHEFLSGLQEHLRNLLVAATLPDSTLIEAAPAVQARYREAAGATAEADVLRHLALAAEAEESLRQASQPRLRLELTLLKMAALAHAADLDAALAQLARVEALVKEGKVVASTAVPAPPARPAAEARPASVRESEARYAPSVPPEADVPRHASIHPMRSVAESDAEAAVPEVPTGTERRGEAEAPEETPQPPARPAPATGADLYNDLFGKPLLRAARPASDADAAPRRTEGSAALASVPAPDASLDRLARVWPALCEEIQRPALRALLALATPAVFSADVLVLAVPDAASARTIEGGASTVLALVEDRMDVRPARLRCDVQPGQVAPAAETGRAFDPLQFIEKQRQEHPVVKAIFEQFGGELVWQ